MKRLIQSIIAVMTLVAATVMLESPALAAEEGPFRIVGEDSQKCMDNPNSAYGNSVGQVIYTCNPDFPENQQWYFVQRTDGYYWIKNGYSDKCLAVSGAKKTNNVAIVQYTCNDGLNQQWVPRFYDSWNGDDYYYLVSRNGDRLDQFSIHVQNASNANNAKLIQYNQVGGSNSRWTWYRVY